MIKDLMKNINKHKWIIISLIIFFILFVIIVNSIKYGKIPAINNEAFNIMNKISTVFKSKKAVESEKTEIEKLKAENTVLRSQLINITLQKKEIEQLTQLKKSLKFVTNKNSSSFISSNIIAKNNGIYYKSFTLSAGKKDGVTTDSIVVNGDGLVGRVYEVSNNFSKAISLLDNRSPISFEIMGRESDTGMLSQDTSMIQISDEGVVKGYMFDANSKVKVGEIITTSGLGLYPSGIPIGKISKVIPDSQNILKYVVIAPFVDLKNINTVMIFNKTNIES